MSGFAYMDVGKGREQERKLCLQGGKDCSRQSICISTIHGGHSKGRKLKPCLLFYSYLYIQRFQCDKHIYLKPIEQFLISL